MKKVFILGGTGFLGYYASREFIKRGWNVISLSLPPEIPKELKIKNLEDFYKDFDKLTDNEILSMLRECYAFVFAAGVDDRVTFKKPSYDKFYKANVSSCKRLVRLAKKAGIKRGVILSSYFLYFHRIWPELELTKYHPYIRSRENQAKECIKEAGEELDLMILELPYIFGEMSGKIPLWKPLIKYINSTHTIYYPKGGTNMIAVEHVAEAIVGAIERGKARHHYTIGDKNLTWVQFIKIILKSLHQNKKIVTVPNLITYIILLFIKLKHLVKLQEGGLDPIKLIKLQTGLTFFDATGSQKELGYSGGDLEEAIDKTVKASLNS